jgi:PAS domain S-box-containing protein
LKQESEYNVAFRLLCKNGEYRWFRARGKAEFDEEGTPLQMAGGLEDIHEKKSLEFENQRLLDVFDSTFDMVVQITSDLNVTYLNEAFRRQIHISGPVESASLKQLHTEKQLRVLKDKVVPALLKDNVWRGELGVKAFSGNELPCSCIAIAHLGNNGKPEFYTCVYRDITDAKKYELAVRGLSVGIWDWDIVTDDLYWSPRFREIIGVPEDQELVNDDFESRLHPQDKDRVLAVVDRHLQQGCPYNIEYRLRHRDGHFVWVKSMGQASWNHEKQPLRMVGSVEDITERKEKEMIIKEKTDFLELIFANSPTILFVKDEAFRIVEANERFLELYPESERDKVIGHYSVEGYSEEEAKEFLKYDQQAFDEGYSDVTETIDFPDGKTRTLYTQKVRFTNGKGDAFILGIAFDVTDREELIKRLQASNRDLDEFAYVASHDLKAPLRVIDNASRWLVEDLGDDLDEDSLENLQLVRSRAVRMEKLLDDLLEYSRIGRKTDQRYQEQVSGTELLADVLLLVDKPDGFNIKISPGFADVTVNCMPLQQIFINLINNAIKHHNSEQGVVEIDVTEEPNHYLFSVKDDGPGIAEEYHERVFGMFQTLKSRDRVEGSGMGLAMVKKHVDSKGGKISLDSQEGKGCLFKIRWPKLTS